ncbi:MAG: hypothetical protein KAQ92_00505 [Candidatus Aenigmarchaeota archaeon]|nr:hypothetical protein [Candidatus Aenigmarchaeota archaeon]
MLIINDNIQFVHNKKRKAQAISLDFYSSLIIFMIIVSGGLMLWNKTIIDNSGITNAQEMNNYANNIANILIRSKGYPLNWTNETVKILGLVENSHLIDYKKTLEMKNVSVYKMNDLFGYAPYILYIQIDNSSDFPVIIDGENLTWGYFNKSIANSISKISRYAILHNKDSFERVSVNVFIWN